MSAVLRLSLLFGIYLLLFSCQDVKEKATPLNVDSIRVEVSKDSSKNSNSDSIINQNEAKPLKKRSIRVVEKEAEPSEMLDEVSAQEQNSILPGSISNTYHQTKDRLIFESIVIEEQDRNVGCSGGSNRLTFSIPLTADSFSYANEQLRSLHLTYRIDGGMYFATGENPSKGKIKGKKKDDSTWMVEVDLLLKIHSDQLLDQDKAIQRSIVFSKSN